MTKLRKRRGQFKSQKDAKNKRDREIAEEAMLREGLNQIKETLADSPGEEEMAQIRDRTEFYKQECEHFEATGRVRYGSGGRAGWWWWYNFAIYLCILYFVCTF